eukprot:CAMPEP_0177662810 /NCGR_PEP_ID=MMETSP0447-20121125/19539_1 /TAXON_ID=0 /ORGANISM="Stygamoeba regulata, Strain BSH-02190019" /LENGTH=159 /DNA_ID=CAMNT_0019168501 /DNA_START=32 /DNA_END=511 /DNA_ORIENTATION=-
MAFHGPAYGMSAEAKAKLDAKRDPAVEAAVLGWLNEMLKDVPGDKVQVLETDLKNGIRLCQLANVIAPGSCKQPKKASMPFIQMENIGNYLDACKNVLGVPDHVLFQTVDLYEAKNMSLVLLHLNYLATTLCRDKGLHHIKNEGPKVDPEGVFSHVSSS